jgi:2-polyprenyl-3-methyl-5-hydroxy-6-metoxy-1,4-benzoquinol methylase
MPNPMQILDINQNSLETFLTCKDHTVSRETFTLLWDKNSDLLVTFPKPEDNKLYKYYESESYISHTDSKKSILDKVYQIVKNFTIKQKIKLINAQNAHEKSILDIGCGTGDFLNACKDKGWKIKGVEPNKKARDLALKKLNSEAYLVNNIKDLLTSSSNRFDVITMWHVLEHIPNLEEYISILKELLKPKGTLIIALPNYKSYDAKYYKYFWAAFDVPRHLWHFSKKAMKLIFSERNFEIVKIYPMKFDAFYVSLLSEKYKTGKSNPIRAFYRGFLSNLKANRSGEYSSLIYILKNKI